MIDRIISFGDSFLFGSDLNDCDNVKNYSHKTWPAMIAKRLGLEYECHAMGGVGNRYISDVILTNSQKNCLVIINWTWIDRFDYYTSTVSKLRKLVTIRPGNNNLITNTFYKMLHSEEDDKFRSLSYAYATHCYLRDNGIPFISTYMDQSLLETGKLESQGIHKLQNQLKKDLKTFPNNQTFLEWSRAKGYPESNNWHPLERAHEKAAEYWLPIYQQAINTHTTTTKD